MIGFAGGGMTNRLLRTQQQLNQANEIIARNQATLSVMAAVEIWTLGPDGKYQQRTDAVRLYPAPLFAKFRQETIDLLASMRPAILKLWILDPKSGRWGVEVHNAP